MPAGEAAAQELPVRHRKAEPQRHAPMRALWINRQKGK